MDARDSLLGKFVDVSRRRVHELSRAWSRLQEGGGRDAESIAALLREIHTVKGESRLMGFDAMNTVAHHIEDLLHALRPRDFRATPEEAEHVLAGLDLLGALIDDGRAPNAANRRTMQRFLGELPNEEPAQVAAERKPAAAAALFRIESAALSDLMDRGAALSRQRDLMDRIAEDVSRVATDLGRSLLRLPASSERDKAAAFAKELAAALGRMQEEAFENRLEIGELQESVRRMRMVRLSALFERIPGAIRALARDLDKQVKIAIDAGTTEVDELVADRLQEPLLHLLRNAVDHGIESPAERTAAGKPAVGVLRLSARHAAGQVLITVEDDGRGVSLEKLRRTAITRELLPEAQVATLDEAGLLDLMFLPGFSTRDTVSDVSGRGIGLDIVKRVVEDLGGTVRVQRCETGTRFELRVPVSLALVRALVVASDGSLFALPSTSVRVVTRVKASDVQTAGDGECIVIDDDTTAERGIRVPLIDLHAALGLPAQASQPEIDVVVVDDGAVQLGLRVARVLGEMQVVRQPMSAFLEGIPALSGTAIIEGGRHCFFLHTSALTRAHGARGGAAQPVAARGARRRRVLVVDDSEITRDMLVSLLQRRGFDAVEAVDGKDALDKMTVAAPDIILSDLDMPGLDGIALIRALRADATTAHVPIVVLSTRGSAQDRERAMNAGANGYLVKSAFKEADLLERFRALVAE